MDQHHSMEHGHSEGEHSGYGVYFVTWLTLLVLTATTVVVAGMNLGRFSVGTAIIVASIKVSLVMLFFMHLKYEAPVFKIMVFCALATFTIFIGLTFVDILFR